MNKILQNMKSGFDNIKELIGILINDEADTAGYDIYMNSNDKDLAKTAMLFCYLI